MLRGIVKTSVEIHILEFGNIKNVCETTPKCFNNTNFKPSTWMSTPVMYIMCKWYLGPLCICSMMYPWTCCGLAQKQFPVLFEEMENKTMKHILLLFWKITLTFIHHFTALAISYGTHLKWEMLDMKHTTEINIVKLPLESLLCTTYMT